MAIARADDVSFESIQREMQLDGREVIAIMRNYFRPPSFAVWRARVLGRRTKHKKRTRLLQQEID